MIACFSNNIKAQSNINVTIAYLRDSIEARKANFTNTSFDYFLNQLQLGVKHYILDAPLPNRPDTLRTNRISLCFNNVENIILRDIQSLSNPCIEIIFTTPVLIPKNYLKKGGILDWTTDWNTAKANFFANKIIYQINVLGL